VPSEPDPSRTGPPDDARTGTKGAPAGPARRSAAPAGAAELLGRAYRQLFDEAPCYISVQDREFRIVQTNRRFREDFGESIGAYCYAAYKRRESRCEKCPVAESFADGEVHRSEETVRGAGGEPIQMVVHAAPLFDEATGEIVAVMEMSTNITEVRRLQSQLAALGQMVAGIAHSIKGILMGLDGGLYVVGSGFRKKQEEVVQTGWEIVRRNVGRISHMLLEILYCAKERVPKLSDVSPTEVAGQVCDLFAEKFRGHEVELVRRFDPDVGTLPADPERLHALLVNLVTNGLDACLADEEERPHHVEVDVGGDSKHVVLEVSDNGLGMDEEAKENLFSPFYSTKDTEGTGLGLLVSQKIVREHGGTISVRSLSGEGTTFTVRLPREAGGAREK